MSEHIAESRPGNDPRLLDHGDLVDILDQPQAFHQPQNRAQIQIRSKSAWSFSNCWKVTSFFSNPILVK